MLRSAALLNRAKLQKSLTVKRSTTRSSTKTPAALLSHAALTPPPRIAPQLSNNDRLFKG